LNEKTANHERYPHAAIVRFSSIINKEMLEKTIQASEKNPKILNEIKYYNKMSYLIAANIAPVVFSKDAEKPDVLEEKEISLEKNPLEVSKTEIEEKYVSLSKIGKKVQGSVTKINGNIIFIRIEKGIIGRLHKAQCDYDFKSKESKFSGWKVGDSIEGKIISIKKSASQIFFDLTTLKIHMEEADCQLNSFGNLEKKSKCYGVVKSVSKSSIHPIYIEISPSDHGYANAFISIFSPSKAQQLNELENHFAPGDVIECQINNLMPNPKKPEETIYEFSLLNGIPNNFFQGERIEKGMLGICRISKVGKMGLRVQIHDNIFAVVPVCEIADE